jgi:sortase (surface protein transpeptidase)
VRGAVQVLGELVITAGVLLLLFTGYLVYGTALVADQDQQVASDELDRIWAEEPVAPVAPAPVAPDLPAQPAPVVPDDPVAPVVDTAPAASTGRVGAPLARLHLPWRQRPYTVLEGTGQDVLARGPGHYPGTALPGEVGNVAIAGHRVGHGAPFDPAGTLVSCDALVVETRDTWWVYRVLPLPGEEDGWAGGAGARSRCEGVATAGVPGREVVAPSDRSVIAAVPGRPDEEPTARLLTLTTCHPRFSARERLIVHAVLVRAQPRAEGRPAELDE